MPTELSLTNICQRFARLRALYQAWGENRTRSVGALIEKFVTCEKVFATRLESNPDTNRREQTRMIMLLPMSVSASRVFLHASARERKQK
jgi:hypothetical protein